MVKFICIDSTQRSQPPPSLFVRLLLAVRRFGIFVFHLINKRPSSVLVFSGNGFSFTEKGFMALVAGVLGIPVVICPRSGLIIDELQSRWFRGLFRILCKRCARIVCQGHYWRDVFAEVLGPDYDKRRLVVIGNAIDPSKYDSIADSANEKSMASISVLYMGWIEKYKGALDLVEAAKAVVAALPDVRFIICGGGLAEGEMQAAIAGAGMERNFDVRGWVKGNDKIRAMNEADLVVLPSHREGFPNVLLEAMASARPIVATDVGAVSDLFRHGDIGELVPPGDPARLGLALLELARNHARRKRCGVLGRDVILRYHDSRLQWRSWMTALNHQRKRECVV